MSRYVIRGGQAGYDRLKLLARERWPYTRALLERAGVGRGMQCLDLGCGGGDVTLEIARLVGSGGRVVGIDMDETKLHLAREFATGLGLTNVEFQAMNVADWRDPNAYDVVYSRFLLQHLRDPVEILGRMWEAVRIGGTIIVEDSDFDGWCCHPPNDGFDFFVRTYRETIAHWGGDHARGRQLYRCFLDSGINAPAVSAVQPVQVEGEGKTLPLTTLEGTKAAIVDAGVATAHEVDAALKSLAEFTSDPRNLISGPRIFQLWSRR